MKLFFIDLDGTIEDSRQDMIEAVNSVRHELELPLLPPEEIEPNVMRGMEHLYRSSFAELFNAGEEDQAVLARLTELYEEDYGRDIVMHTEAYEGIPGALQGLNELGPVCVYTNKPQGLSRKLLTELQLSRYANFIVGCDTFPQSKPAREPMDRIAADTGFKVGSDQAYMIGDSAGDMQAARAFGATAVWCAWGYYSSAPTEPAPDLIAQKPAELLNLVQSQPA